MRSAEIVAAARKLLAHDLAWAPSAARIAARAEAHCESLSRHLARVLGETGSRALFHRSLVLTRARIPWIADVTSPAAPGPGVSPWASLRISMEHQDPRVAVEVYAAFLSTFVQLLGRLVGDPLVSRLLHEIWPKFPHAVAVKEPS